MNTVFEFILWPNCKNNCKFCWQKQQIKEGKQHLLSPSEKARSIIEVIHFLQSDKLEYGSHVLLVGGELFDSHEVDTELNCLLQFCIGLMIIGKIDLLYINTNLIYKIREKSPLMTFLSTIEEFDLFNRLHFTTSFDLDGRFNEDSKTLMLNNLGILQFRFKKLQSVTNIILTNTTCSAILNKSFDYLAFEEKYTTHIHPIPYIELNSELTPERIQIIQTLQYIDSIKPGFIADYLMRMDLNQDKRLYMFDGSHLVNVSAPLSECGHSSNFKLYTKSHSCFICDMKEVFE